MKTFSIGGVHPNDNKISADAAIHDFDIPVKVCLGVFHLGLDIVNISADGDRQLFSDFRRFACGGEICYQFIAHHNHSLSECGCPVCFLEADEDKIIANQKNLEDIVCNIPFSQVLYQVQKFLLHLNHKA